MANIFEKGKALGVLIGSSSMINGMEIRRIQLSGEIQPVFKISQEQHRRIMEILGVKNHKLKKDICSYRLSVKGPQNIRHNFLNISS